jgi:hypothetical protein
MVEWYKNLGVLQQKFSWYMPEAGTYTLQTSNDLGTWVDYGTFSPHSNSTYSLPYEQGAAIVAYKMTKTA